MQNIKVFIIVIVFVDFPVIFFIAFYFYFLLFDYGYRLPHSLLLQFKWLRWMYAALYGPCMIVPHKWMKICWLATAN